MRILLANKFYYRRGGDCIYTMNLEKMLKEKGHEVAMYAMQYPENEPSEWADYWPTRMTTLDALTRPFGTRQVVKGFTRLLNDFKPDVVHLNNIHTQLSPIIAKIAHERDVRVVWTLHDTKLVCPCYTCSRQGRWCTECFTHKTAVIKHRCMPGGLAGACIGFLEAKKWNNVVLQKYVDLFMPPSQFMMNTCVAGGYDARKFRVLCNFMDDKKVAQASRLPLAKEDYYVYLGRVDAIKGVRTLCEAASCLPMKLIIVGGGELLPELQQRYKDKTQIVFKGQQAWHEFMPILRQARFMVLPAECSENNPLTVIESLSIGTPVLGANIGGIPELLEEGVNGMTFTSGNVDDLKQKIMCMFNHPFHYDAIAQHAAERFSSEAYYEKLMACYKGL